MFGPSSLETIQEPKTQASAAAAREQANRSVNSAVSSALLVGSLVSIFFAIRTHFLPTAGIEQHLFAPVGITLMVLSVRVAGQSSFSERS